MSHRKKLSTEVKRQLLHFLLGVFCISFLFFFGLDFFRFFLVFLFLIGFVLFALAYYHVFKPLNDLLKEVEREHEKYPGEAAFFFVAGISVVAWFFSNPFIVMGSMVVLTFQDSVATFVGVLFGRHFLLGRKTWEGTLAGFLAGFLGLSVFFPLNVVFLVMLATTIVELLPINDALTIPVTAAFLLQVLV